MNRSDQRKSMAVAIFAGIAAMPFGSPAFAHSPTGIVGVCNPSTGMYDVTATWKNPVQTLHAEQSPNTTVSYLSPEGKDAPQKFKSGASCIASNRNTNTNTNTNNNANTNTNNNANANTNTNNNSNSQGQGQGQGQGQSQGQGQGQSQTANGGAGGAGGSGGNGYGGAGGNATGGTANGGAGGSSSLANTGNNTGNSASGSSSSNMNNYQAPITFIPASGACDRATFGATVTQYQYGVGLTVPIGRRIGCEPVTPKIDRIAQCISYLQMGVIVDSIDCHDVHIVKEDKVSIVPPVSPPVIVTQTVTRLQVYREPAPVVSCSPMNDTEAARIAADLHAARKTSNAARVRKDVDALYAACKQGTAAKAIDGAL